MKRLPGFGSDTEAKRAAAEVEAREALAGRDLRRASLAVARFEASQPVPRGMGVDWSRYDPEPDVAALSALFERWPRLLAFVPEESRDALRLVAAETFLWGRSRPAGGSYLLPNVKGPLDALVTCRMLGAFGQTERKLHDYRECGVKRIVLYRDGSCAGCQTGPSVLPIQSAPEIPRPECTNPAGCRCDLRPATEKESGG